MLEYLLELLIPSVSNGYRETSIEIINWNAIIIITEADVVIGEIFVHNWPEIEDYDIKNYFNLEPLNFDSQNYIEQIFEELKTNYDAIELRDGKHPITFKDKVIFNLL